jgi:hypothetical protein
MHLQFSRLVFLIVWLGFGLSSSAQSVHLGYTQGPILKYAGRVDMFISTGAMLASPHLTIERIVFQNRWDYLATWIGMGPYLHGGDSHTMGWASRFGLAYRTLKHNVEHLEFGSELIYYLNTSEDSKISPLFLLGYVREDIYKPSFNYKINLTINPWGMEKERFLTTLVGIQLGVSKRF